MLGRAAANRDRLNDGHAAAREGEPDPVLHTLKY